MAARCHRAFRRRSALTADNLATPDATLRRNRYRFAQQRRSMRWAVPRSALRPVDQRARQRRSRWRGNASPLRARERRRDAPTPRVASRAAASERDAYAAMSRKAPPLAQPVRAAPGACGRQLRRYADHRWRSRAWIEPPTAGSIGGAVGADYRFSPDTRAGFALAGGGTNFTVDNSGTGRSDLFQAGAFVRTISGPPICPRRSPMAGRTSPRTAP